MKNVLQTFDFLSATSDIWTRYNKSFIAVTVHCTNSESLETESFFIACEKFEGRHTKGAVAQKLHDIFKKYDILDKVHYITTDAAGEYVYAIKDHGDCYGSLESLLANDYLEDFLENNDVPESVPSEVRSVCESANNESSTSAQSESESHSTSDRSDNSNDEEQYPDPFLRYDPFEIETRDIDESGEIECRKLLPLLNRVACSSHLLDKVIKIKVHHV